MQLSVLLSPTRFRGRQERVPLLHPRAEPHEPQAHTRCQSTHHERTVSASGRGANDRGRGAGRSEGELIQIGESKHTRRRQKQIDGGDRQGLGQRDARAVRQGGARIICASRSRLPGWFAEQSKRGIASALTPGCRD